MAEKIKHTFYKFPPQKKNHALFVRDIMWKNIVELDRPLMTTWRMHFAYWITKATDTHSLYVIFIDFPLQQW